MDNYLMTFQQDTYDASECRKIASQHPLWQHDFLKRCREGQLAQPEIRVLAIQMYKFCQSFNRILIRILDHCPDEAVRVTVSENLFEELGEGDSEQTHPALFRRFTRALGIADDILEATPPEPETAAMIETYLNMVDRYGYLAALSSICYASEGIVRDLYSQLQQGILGITVLPQASLKYFELHIHVDDGHAEKLARIIEPRIQTPSQRQNVRAAIVEGLSARVRFFDGVQRQARALSNLSSFSPLSLACPHDVCQVGV
jgi:pyrroloquinoline-quinone synthase